MFSFSLDKYSEVGLLDHMVILFSCLLFFKHLLSLALSPFFLSFLPPGGAATGLKAACDPRIRAREEGGFESSKTFASENLTTPDPYEAVVNHCPPAP